MRISFLSDFFFPFKTIKPSRSHRSKCTKGNKAWRGLKWRRRWRVKDQHSSWTRSFCWFVFIGFSSSLLFHLFKWDARGCRWSANTSSRSTFGRTAQSRLHKTLSVPFQVCKEQKWDKTNNCDCDFWGMRETNKGNRLYIDFIQPTLRKFTLYNGSISADRHNKQQHNKKCFLCFSLELFSGYCSTLFYCLLQVSTLSPPTYFYFSECVIHSFIDYFYLIHVSGDLSETIM